MMPSDRTPGASEALERSLRNGNLNRATQPQPATTAGPGAYTARDFASSPFVAFYEVTRACDLHCRHCRASAQPRRHPNELTTSQSKALLSQFATFPKRPVLVFTGGDPMKREDLFELVEYAVAAGLTVAMTPSATPLVTPEAVRRMKESGVSRLAVSIDGANAATHDAFRGVSGSFQRSLEILADARAAGLPLQVNTTITRRNTHQVDEMAELLAGQRIVLWSVFFLIPVGRGRSEERLSAVECEWVFERLWQQSQRQPYAIKTTEAPHYRRYVLQRLGDPQRQPNANSSERIMRAPLGVGDGRGVMFVSHTGSIYPSGFMPIWCGQFPNDSIIDVYQNSEIFQALRNPDGFHGKCSVCDYRQVCGGSRARAYAVKRDALAAEPDCAYLPPAWQALAPVATE